MRDLLRSVKKAVHYLRRGKGRYLVNLSFAQLGARLLPAYLLSQPTHLQIEPTTACNLDCLICGRHQFTRRSKNMSLPEFRRIIAQFPFLRSVSIQGFGEPLLNKDIYSMIAYCYSKGIKTVTVTNGVLLDYRAGENLVQCGLDTLIISVDSPQPQVFENIRRGASFEQVCDNVKAVVALKKGQRAEAPKVVLRATAMKENIFQLPQLVNLAKELGADGVSIANLIPVDGTEMAIPEQLVANLDPTNVHRAFTHLSRDNALDIAIQDGIATPPHIQAEPRERWLRKRGYYCWWAWEGSYIEEDGYVSPCCYSPYYRRDPYDVGPNIFETPFARIWNSPQWRQLRRELASGKPPAMCRGCWVVRAKMPRENGTENQAKET
ncbi:MAG: radical SAM protein [Chloroflexi bacterium]|nr:radical SAM protein [Chloroflexota bacterium]